MTKPTSPVDIDPALYEPRRSQRIASKRPRSESLSLDEPLEKVQKSRRNSNVDSTSKEKQKRRIPTKKKKKSNVHSSPDQESTSEQQSTIEQQTTVEQKKPRKPRKKKEPKEEKNEEPEEPKDISNMSLREIINLCSSKKRGSRKKKSDPSDESDVKLENEENVEENDEQQVKEEEEEEHEGVDTENVKIAPQVLIVDGKIVINQESFIQKQPTIKKNVIVNDKPRIINSASFRKTPISSKRWTKEETKKFYDALRMFGTNFQLMSFFVGSRSRDQIRNKYKTEESKNPHLIEWALRNRLKISNDICELILEKSGAKPKTDPNTDTNQEETNQTSQTDLNHTV